MNRKYISLLIISILLFGIGFGYLLIRGQAGKDTADPWKAIPSSAAIITVFNSPEYAMEDVYSDSALEGLFRQPILDIISQWGDDNSRVQLFKSSGIFNGPVFLSYHPMGSSETGVLVVRQLKTGISERKIFRTLADGCRARGDVAERSVMGTRIIDFTPRNQRQNFSFSIFHGLFIGSSSSVLLEDGIECLQKGTPLPEELTRLSVAKTAGKKNINCYVNFKNLSEYLSRFTTTENLPLVKSLAQFSSWNESDLFFRPGITMFSGFSAANDSSRSYQKILLNQEPQGFDVIRNMPGNTSAFCIIGIQDPQKYLSDYEKLGLNSEQYRARILLLGRLKEEYGIYLDSLFLSFCGNQLAICSTSDTIYGSDGNIFEFLKVKNPVLTEKLLSSLNSSDNRNQDNNLFKTIKTEDGTLFRLYRMPVPFLTKILFGQLFGLSENKYFMLTGDVLVFGNSPQAMSSLANDYVMQRTLFYDVKYNEFEENIDSSANLYFYYNPGKDYRVKKALVNQWGASSLVKKMMEPNVSGLGLQFRRNNGMLFGNFVMITRQKESNKGLHLGWKVRLDTNVLNRPYLVENYTTGRKEILVQDCNKKLYLIGNGGQVIWTLPFQEEITGEVKQLDYFGNGKLQMMFLTNSAKIHLLDRNGKEVEGFPVKLAFQPVSPLFIADFDGKKEYRIYVGTSDNTVFCMDKSGKMVKAWTAKRLDGPVKGEIQAFRSGRLDYIVVNGGGSLYILNRKGEERIKLKESLHIADNPVFVERKGRGDRILGLSAGGSLFRISLDGKLDIPQEFKGYSGSSLNMAETGIDGQKNYIYFSRDSVIVVNQEGKMLSSFPKNFGAETQTSLVVLPDGNTCLTMFSADSSALAMVNLKGDLLPGFPQEALTQPLITSLRAGEGKFNLLIGGKYNFLFNFIME